MASNEIELTFIRCPSCKSLMPSTAHKCGMCGLSMDEEEAIPTEKKLRLRQRTSSDIGDITANSEQEGKAIAESNIESNLENKEAQESPSRQVKFAQKDHSDDHHDDSEESYSEDDVDYDEDGGDKESVDQTEDSTDANVEPIKKRKRRRRKKKKLSSEDSQSSSQDQAHSLDIDRSYQEVRSSDSNWVENIKSEDSKEATIPQQPVDKTNIYRDLNFFEKEISESKDSEAVENVLPLESFNEAPVSKTDEKKIIPNANENKGAKMNDGNKLLGWFVNYSTDLNGKYFEIRAGKKFIGRQELRPHDMLIPDSAISTPHCLLNAEGGKLGLQDLMSDQGTFVRHAGESDFKKIESTVQLVHGDVLKLGTFELIVCLIPNV